MNYKKKSLMINIFLIITIQILLLVNNSQKTSFRYFVWNIQEVSIGRLIFISFVSGLLISSLLNKTQNNNIRSKSEFDEDSKTSNENDYSTSNNNINELFENTPKRDLREPQPTISVNYRVIKNNGENEIIDRNQAIKDSQYDDDWSNNNSEW